MEFFLLDVEFAFSLSLLLTSIVFIPLLLDQV
jgi:hypothetical protein